MMPITSRQIKARMFKEVFERPLMDNSMRGYWCEYMITEALGDKCKMIGAGWHPWDLEIGSSEDEFPNRIRIQVKNSARLQMWSIETGKLSACQFGLTYRKRPSYFQDYNPGIPCEEHGFLCDLYILCLHEEENIDIADHTDPKQWKFYLVPVVGERSGVTKTEIAYASKQHNKSGKPSKCMRRPRTMETGIRERPPIVPIGIDDLTMEAIYKAMGLTE